MSRVRAGETDAYAELVRRHAPIARRTAVLLGTSADADDVVQESLVKAYRALGSFREGASFRPWLLKIVANEARNQVRSAHRRAVREERSVRLSTDLLAAAEAGDPSSSVLSGERRSELLSALGRLPEPHRLVVTCRYLLELDEQETATVLGWPKGTVKSRSHRALLALRTELDRAATVAGVIAYGKEAGHADR